MKQILERLVGIEGISGAVIHDGAGIIESSLPRDISPELADKLGHFVKMAEMGGAEAGISAKKITFYFNDLIIVSSYISGNVSLNLICIRKVNLSLLDAALNAVSTELAAKCASRAKKENIGVDNVLLGPLAFHIQRIQEICSEYIGPVAVIIVREAIEKWISKGPPTASRLSHLIAILGDEIDQSDRPGFISKAKTIIDKMTG